MQRKTDEIDVRSLRDILRHALEQGLGHEFVDRALLRLALTHRSYANERGDDSAGTNYERLEFLGDAVLGLVTSAWLYETFPNEAEGVLARRKSFLVSAPVLSRQATVLGVGPLLRLGVGEERTGGRTKRSILANAMEALFGAVYLDGGMDAARSVILPVLERGLEEQDRVGNGDAKTTLQERLQGDGRPLPSYHLVNESGPDHAKTFAVEVRVDGVALGTAEGRSKKIAEQGAASAALAALDLSEGRS